MREGRNDRLFTGASLAAPQRLRPKVDYVTTHPRRATDNVAGALPAIDHLL
jgi:hypothetical protein